MPMLQEIQMNSTEFKPLKDYLLLKPDLATNMETLKSGIVICNKVSVTQRPCSGIVLAKGENCTDIEVGDYVVFPDTDGIDLKLLDSTEENKFMLLRYASIIGKKSQS